MASSLPEPPPNVPRIVEVQSPASGHYVVMVRMPTQLAAKYPDKPWGTSIADIGLAKVDSDRFPGYELVDVEPMKGSPDLYWIFQKLPGPTWTTKTKGQDSLVPAKYRSLVETTQAKQEVKPATLPDNITGNLTQSVVQQQDDTGKAVKINTEETINANAAPLVGQLTDTWGINTTEERLVTEGSAVDSGFGVKGSRVSPLGNGKSIKETERYPAGAGSNGIICTLTGYEKDEATEAKIRIEKSLVNASSALSLANSVDGYAEVQPIDQWHSILIVCKVIEAPKNKTWKETGNISLPNKLVEAGVIWDSDQQTDSGYAHVDNPQQVIANNIGWSATSEASATGSVFGRPYTKVEAGYSGPAEITVERTYHNEPPNDNIQAHKFTPVYGTIVINGAQGMRQGQATARGQGGLQTGSSQNYRHHFDTKMAITQFGPFEHSGVSLTEKGDNKIVNAQSSASSGSTPGPEAYPAVTATLQISGSASLELPPSSAPLISGQTFILSVNVAPWRYGYWVKEVRTAKVP